MLCSHEAQAGLRRDLAAVVRSYPLIRATGAGDACIRSYRTALRAGPNAIAAWRDFVHAVAVVCDLCTTLGGREIAAVRSLERIRSEAITDGLIGPRELQRRRPAYAEAYAS